MLVEIKCGNRISTKYIYPRTTVVCKTTGVRFSTKKHFYSFTPAPVEIYTSCKSLTSLSSSVVLSAPPSWRRHGLTSDRSFEKNAKNKFCNFFSSFLCRKGESNPRPTDYESVALPTVPFRLVNLL